MQIQGSSKKATESLRKLDFKKLAELTADILAVQGHYDIKVTDGPGDGCRDIHSIDKKGNKHLTQCKHHEDISKTLSSRETGELPLGLVKFGYKKGLFCTNARISPQSKREFIDNYPDLELDYWEGTNIPSIVFDNIIIRSIWFDGKSIDKISYVIVIPVLGRDIEKNKPIPIFELLNFDQIILDNNIHISLRKSSLKYSNFEPYLPPQIRTPKEGWGWGSCLEMAIQGPVRFEEIENIQHSAAEKIISLLSKNKKLKTTHYAIRLGKPHISPLSGESAGSQIELNCKPLTLLKYDSNIKLENEWLLPSSEFNWYMPSRVQTPMADWARWYNPNADICLDLNIISRPSSSMLGMIEEQYEYFVKWWEKSLFALVRNDYIDQFESIKIDQPSEVVDWYENQSLCCWKHGNLASGFRHMLIEIDDFDDPDLPKPFEVDPIKYENFYHECKNKLKKISAKFIDPIKARHMIAVKSSDPFPSKDSMIYRSIELMYHYQEIPSPIDPKSRRIIFTKAWLISEKDKLIANDKFLEHIENVLQQSSNWILNSSVFDNETITGTYYVLYLESNAEIGLDDTNQELEKILKSYSNFVSNIEKEIKLFYPKAVNRTIKFWENEIGMYFQAKKIRNNKNG